MSVIIYPIDDRDYNADDVSGYLATRTSGVFATEDNFPVTVTGERTIKIGDGIAWIKDSRFTGRSVINKGEVSLSLSVADGVYDRIDRVVIRYNKEANDCFLTVLEGTPSSEPVAPDIVRTDFIYDLGIYTILVEKATLSISESNITSTMLDEEVCGVMRDGVTGLPTAQIQAQAEKLLADMRAAMEQIAGMEIPDGSIGTEKFTDDAKTPFSALADNSNNGAFLVTCEVELDGSNNIYKLIDVPSTVDVVDVKFIAPKDFDGETFLSFLINGEKFDAYLQNGDGLTNGFFAKDRVVTASVDFTRKAINFKSSGGSLKFAKGKITIRDLTYSWEIIRQIEIPTPFKAQHIRLYTEADVNTDFIQYNGDFYDEDISQTSGGVRWLSSWGEGFIGLKQGSSVLDSGWLFNKSKTDYVIYEMEAVDYSITLKILKDYGGCFLPLTTYIFEIWGE